MNPSIITREGASVVEALIFPADGGASNIRAGRLVSSGGVPVYLIDSVIRVVTDDHGRVTYVESTVVEVDTEKTDWDGVYSSDVAQGMAHVPSSPIFFQ